MSEGGDDIDKRAENHVGDAIQPYAKSNDMSPQDIGNSKEDSILSNGNPISDDTQDHLMQTMAELKFQNEYFKSHFHDLKNLYTDSTGSIQQTKTINQDETHEDSKELHDKIESLNKELIEERQTRAAAEAALEHLRIEYSEADAKCQELAAKLAEGCINYLFTLCYCYLFFNLSINSYYFLCIQLKRIWSNR